MGQGYRVRWLPVVRIFLMTRRVVIDFVLLHTTSRPRVSASENRGESATSYGPLLTMTVNSAQSMHGRRIDGALESSSPPIDHRLGLRRVSPNILILITKLTARMGEAGHQQTNPSSGQIATMILR